MGKGREFKPFSVVTQSYKLFNQKTFKLFNISNKELEGNAIPLIAFRYPSDKYQLLEELLQKLGILPLKKGEPMSKAYQLLIDKLIDGTLLTNPVGVTTQQPQKPKNQRYCKDLSSWVSVKEVCEKCRLVSSQKWLNCPEVLKEQGIK